MIGVEPTKQGVRIANRDLLAAAPIDNRAGVGSGAFWPWQPLTFALLQLVACVRIYAEFAHDAPRWLVIAAFGWLLAFLPWVARSLWIFATPRIDGKPG